MPFQSKAQRRWMWATHPGMARKWEDATPAHMSLPNHVRDAEKSVAKKIAKR